jgi:hypothetical protein
MVDIEARLAEALRVVLGFAVADTPEWAPQGALDARQRAYVEAHFALALYDEQEPAVVTALSPPVVVRDAAGSCDGALALAS